MSAGLFGSAVSSSITTSASDSRRTRSSPGASNALTRATAAPSDARTFAPASDRGMPLTACPRLTNSATRGRPIAPLAPATNTCMGSSLGVPAGLLLPFRKDEVPGIPRVHHPRQHPDLRLAGVLRDAVQAPGRLVERVARLQGLGGVVVD